LRRLLSTISAIVLLSGCAHSNSPDRAKDELTEADKRCTAKTWPTTVAHMACLTSLEEPIVRRQLPATLDSFRAFAAKRLGIAEQTDLINMVAIAASAKYRASNEESFAVLKAHEPKLNASSATLTKEWNEAKAPSVCKQPTSVEQATCIGSILRPIWERDAPETLVYFDEYLQKQQAFSREFDASGAIEARKRAVDYFTINIRQALAEWHDRSQRDIQAANQQDAASNAQELQAFGDILNGIAAVTLAVAQAKSAQQPAVYYTAPAQTHCVSRDVLGTVYTNCN
jgi:hypothetical protein